MCNPGGNVPPPNPEVDVENVLTEVHGSVSEFRPEEFIRTNQTVSTKSLSLLRCIYDFTKTEEANTNPVHSVLNLLDEGIGVGTKKSKSKKRKHLLVSQTERPVNNLIVDAFDEDQIWQELQLQNNLMYETLVTVTSKILAKSKNIQVKSVRWNSDSVSAPRERSELGDPSEPRDIDASGQFEGEDDDEDDDEEVEFQGQDGEKESALPQEDPEGSGSESDNSQSNDGEEKDDEPSTFEKKRRKIEENIELIENAALDEKPWKYKGEITAEKRPENSLLEEHLVYDSLVRPAPEITVETTQKLEDIIKQRIKDKAWDDVERKFKPIEDPSEFKKKIVLSTEKSKMSLAQIYEQEYINKKKAEEGEAEVESKPEEELVIEKDMNTLFAKLDALSNFHYTPKPVSAEIKIVTNVPAIAMEEVAPVHVADATLLAPQEIQAPAKGEIKGKEERSTTDKKRERRVKKKKQKFIHQARQEKEKLREERAQAKLNLKNAAAAAEAASKPRKNQIKFKGT